MSLPGDAKTKEKKTISNRNRCAAIMVPAHFGSVEQQNQNANAQNMFYQEDTIVRPGACDQYYFSDRTNPDPSKWGIRTNGTIDDMTEDCRVCIAESNILKDCPCNLPEDVSQWTQGDFDKYSNCIKDEFKNHKTCESTYHTIFNDCPNIYGLASDPTTTQKACALDKTPNSVYALPSDSPQNSILGLTPTIFYSVAGAIGLVLLLVILYFIMKKSKKSRR